MDFLPKIVYQDNNLLLARKPHGVASSRGQEVCFLDMIKKYGSDKDGRKTQLSLFGEENEYGLLNRLDNVTAGLLYFARSTEAKEKYLQLQYTGTINKIYYAQVYGSPRASFGSITTALYHYRDDATRMTTDPEKGRGKTHEVTTYYEVIGARSSQQSKDKRLATSDNSILKITISSGCRHQIRCHLASIGYPIVGDRLYMSRESKKLYPDGEANIIELVSAGLEIVSLNI